MTTCSCMYAECAKAGRCLAGSKGETARALIDPLPVYYDPKPSVEAPAAAAGVDERAMFEAWADTDSRDLTPEDGEDAADSNGLYYRCDSTNHAFIGWRQARRLAPPAAAAWEAQADKERFDFVLAQCREAQEVATRYGWALNAIAALNPDVNLCRDVVGIARAALAPKG